MTLLNLHHYMDSMPVKVKRHAMIKGKAISRVTKQPVKVKRHAKTKESVISRVLY